MLVKMFPLSLRSQSEGPSKSRGWHRRGDRRSRRSRRSRRAVQQQFDLLAFADGLMR